MILCDTNIFIASFRGNLTVQTELRRLGESELAINSIVRAELYYGARNKRDLERLRQVLDRLQQFELTQLTSLRLIELMEQFSISHRPGIPDMLIAATALEHQLPLYTLNVKDFRFIPDLQLHQPSL